MSEKGPVPSPRLTSCISRLTSQVSRLSSSFADIFYPPRCPACGELRNPGPAPDGHGLCTLCAITVVPCQPPMCPRCGLPYTGAAGPDHACTECNESPPPFETARAAFLYGGAVHDMIAAFKYAKKIHAGETLVAMAMETGTPAAAAAGCEIAVPVPLNWWRMLGRGFNQSAVIARALSGHLGLRFEPAVMRRTRRTPSQAGLSRKERETNLRGAFTVAAPDRVRDKSVLLVDDVHTTGATIRECSKALLRAGAASVRVFTLARTA